LFLTGDFSELLTELANLEGSEEVEAIVMIIKRKAERISRLYCRISQNVSWTVLKNPVLFAPPVVPTFSEPVSIKADLSNLSRIFDLGNWL